jgi:hypothetical protein
VFIIGLLFLQSTAILANSCVGHVGNGFVSGDYCNVYYGCANEVATLNACPDGYLFDFETQMCNIAEQVVCNKLNNPCDGSVGSTFVPGTNCNEYYACVNGVTQPYTCPNGYYFDVLLQICNHADQVFCGSVNPCVGNVGINFVPGVNCEDYYTCVNDVPVPKKCPTGFYFDASQRICNYAEEVVCNIVSSNPCEGNVGNKFVPGSLCDDYYTCADDVATQNKCPAGLYFDVVRQMCNFADQVLCDGTNPCAGIAGNSFVPGSNCDEYYTCVDGVAHPHTCPDGYFFDVSQKNCNHADLVTCK